ncbi:immunoglobulin I-set domain protein [Oesophagostomum dentatum]|uniref:Immunoglobulin I-set domain protein n=1 Tax=Oesophagostomum dentatum TaxID=61180 RepID=A0A0B1TT75_OESDE|nr:immunoglobulin I-set domain protein [Oesophagostomum dentatum]
MHILLIGLFTTVLAELNYKHVRESVKNLNSILDKAELSRKAELRFVSTEMQDRIIRTGSSLELKCEVYSVPPPVVTWTLNGKKIAGTEEANFLEKLLNLGKSTLQNGVVTSRIRIPCAEKKHRGKYRCIITNGHHTVEASAKIAVAGAKRCEAAQPAPPQIIQATDSRFEIQDNAVQLMCRVAQPDQATITWYFLQDDEIRVPLMDDPNFETLPNGDLIVKRCDFETRVGTYLCVASNDYGEDRAEAWLYCSSPSSPEEDA